MFKPHKLAIIGLGHVGSAVLARAIACQLAAEIVCIDIKPEVAHGETMRLKAIVGQHYHVNAADVQGYMLGEHGNSAFPAWSTVGIGGVPLKELDEFYDHEGELNLAEIGQEVVNTAYDVVQSKGWTNTGIAMGACRLAKAVLLDEHAVCPVSVPLKGEYGLTEVALSLPSVIGKNGVEKRLPLHLPEEELALLKKSAESIQEVLRSNGVI